jgi:hypothetical protein
MPNPTKPRKVVLPNSWPRSVRSALVHVISLAQYAAVYTRSWAAESRNARAFGFGLKSTNSSKKSLFSKPINGRQLAWGSESGVITVVDLDKLRDELAAFEQLLHQQ